MTHRYSNTPYNRKTGKVGLTNREWSELISRVGVKNTRSIIYPEEGTYSGTVRIVDDQVVRYGYGIFIGLNKKNRYEGEWIDDKKCGMGEQYYQNGNHYDGECVDGKRHGHGIYTYKEECMRYNGMWLNDKTNGKGRLYLSYGRIEGMFDGDIISLEKIIMNDGSIYTGEIELDKDDRTLSTYTLGTGKMYYVDGTLYEGQFKNNKRHGQGNMIYNDKSVYEGFWENDERHGSGKITYAGIYDSNGDRLYGWLKRSTFYEGEWINDKISGHGKVFYKNGTIFNGKFDTMRSSIAKGQGTMNYPDGSSYTGSFRLKTRHGKGTMNYVSGDVYTGLWKNNRRHGQGKMAYENGNVDEGQWIRGVFLRPENITDKVRDVDERTKHLIRGLYKTSEQKMCSICMVDIDNDDPDFEVRKCGHIYHNECWQMYKMSKYDKRHDPAICPYCRA